MKVIWSKTADRNYRENLDYLKKDWSNEILKKFIDKTESCILKIKQNPYIGKFDPLIDCNKILVVKQIYLFYEVKNDTLYIHNIWNNKRKPYWF